MEIILVHFWIIVIPITVVNGLVLKFRFKKYIIDNPSLKEGYNKYLKGILLYGNIPWIIAIIGNIGGMTNNIFEYLNPKAMNPIVLLFHASIIVLWILSVYWIYFNGGAEFIEDHPGLFRKTVFFDSSNVTAKQVKLFFPFILLGCVAGMIMLWVTDIPMPQF